MKSFKRISAFIFALTLVLGLVSCGGDESTDNVSTGTSEAASENTSEITSEVVSETASEAVSETTSEETSEGESDFPAEECIEWKDYKFHFAQGEFGINALGDIETTSENSIAVVIGDSFSKGKISASLVANGGEEADNDNGIIFGLEDAPYDYFWEEARPYYFLFVSDNCSLYLAKVAYNDVA